MASNSLTETRFPQKPICPSCKTILDVATSTRVKEIPGPGDISVCIKCRAILQFQTDYSLHVAPAEVLRDIRKNQPEEWRMIIKIIRFFEEKANLRRQEY